MKVSVQVWTLDDPDDYRFRYQQDFGSEEEAVQYLRWAATNHALVLERAYRKNPEDTVVVAIPWSYIRVVEVYV
jgi:hypothetical protein